MYHNDQLSRTQKFVLSSSCAALYQIALFISGLVVPRVILTYYSSAINGVVASITQFVSYFSLVEAGLSGAAVYALYKPLANRDYKAISGIVTVTKKSYNHAGYVFIALLVCCSVLYPMFVTVEGMSLVEISLLVFVLGVASAIEFFTLGKYRAILSADQRSYIISIGSIVHVIINTVIICCIASFRVSIVLLRAIALLSVLARTLILTLYVNRKYPQINYKTQTNTLVLEKRWDALYMQILGAIHAGAPIIILTFIVKDMALVSVFSVYNMVLTGIYGIMSIFSSGIAASFGDTIVRGEKAVMQNAYQQFELVYLCISTIIYATAMVMIMPFVTIYTTGILDTNYIFPRIGALITINGFVYSMKSPQAMMLIAGGLYKESRTQTTIQGLIMIVFGVLLGVCYGIEGILIAAVASNIYRDIDLLFFIPKHITKLPVRVTVRRWIMFSVALVVTVVLGNLIKIDCSGYLAWCYKSLIIVALAGIMTCFTMLLFDKKIFMQSLRTLKNALTRK